MTDKYILDGHIPVPCEDVIVWEKWLGKKENRRVASCRIGIYDVSTIFLGLDHQFGDGPPLLFETMIFGGNFEKEYEYQNRCSTWEEAEQMHQKAVALVESIV